MLLKSKIFFTSVVIYEIIAVSFLHFQNLCDSIFSSDFCTSWYRYFLFCIVIPLIALLIWIWICEIISIRSRRRFIRRAKKVATGILSSIRGHISETISSTDLEKIITAAVLIGIKQYADRHPSLRKNVNKIMGLANGEIDIDLISADDETPKKQTRKQNQKTTKPKRTR
ncbi:MAG: hypothetical protein R8N50_02520 [Alphaproteobacteria bacterium]|nr:hypothetical protein [Alphaproteobacteria bacterium]